MQAIWEIYQSTPMPFLAAIAAAEWIVTVWLLRKIAKRGDALSEEDLDKLREAGERMGRLLATVETLVQRVSRLEKMLIAVVGGILAAWAKSKGLW